MLKKNKTKRIKILKFALDFNQESKARHLECLLAWAFPLAA
jgi:hypothetical protein